MDLALEMPRSSKSQGCNLFHPRNNGGDFLIRERVKEGLDGPSTRCSSIIPPVSPGSSLHLWHG